ncbi:protein AATF-like [Amphiura filiformis]|uniref:protein AATF-like n=1 Tax=Amphiura filiformis TaxID=82378 RepID=UPI003B213B21
MKTVLMKQSVTQQPSRLRKLTSLPLSEGDKRYAGQTTSRNDWLAGSDSDGEGIDDDDNDDDDEDDDEDEYDDDDDDDIEDKEEETDKNIDDKKTGDNLMHHFKKIAAEMDEESGSGSDDDSSSEEESETDDRKEGANRKKTIHPRELLDMSDDIEKQSEEDEINEEEESEEDDDDGSDEEISAKDDDDDDEEDTGFSSDEDRTAVKPFSQGSLQEELQRGKATKAQLGLWDGLLEARIKLQKAVSCTNQMPQHDTLDEFVDHGGDELEDALSKGTKDLEILVSAMIELQETLLLQNPETKHVVDGTKPQSSKQSNGDDEEIPSDDEEIPSDDEEIPSDDEEIASDDEIVINKAKMKEKQSTKVKKSQGVKRKIDSEEFGDHLTKRHKDFEQYRNTAIQKWHDRTKLSAGKISSKSFSSFDKSPLAQIQQVLQDKDRLIKRTQLKRTAYKVLGKAEADDKQGEDAEKEEESMTSHNAHLKDYDPEIFDDDDFYHQLLRELIEKRTVDTSDPVQLTRQWLEVQKLRSKVKKRVDTKASKGRKLRYDVHQKLVSFMAPIDGCNLTGDARNELYGSLFGQRKFNQGEVAER